MKGLKYAMITGDYYFGIISVPIEATTRLVVSPVPDGNRGSAHWIEMMINIELALARGIAR